MILSYYALIKLSEGLMESHSPTLGCLGLPPAPGLQSGPHRRAVPPPRGVHGAGRGGGILLLVRAADGGRDEAAPWTKASGDGEASGEAFVGCAPYKRPPAEA